MKVLWLVNTIMPDLAVHMGEKPSVFGGWLVGAMRAVRDSGADMVVCCTASPNQKNCRYEVNGVIYYLVEAGSDEELNQRFHSILSAEKPNLIHVFGTEYQAVLPFLQVSDPERTVLTLQGALQYIAENYAGGIPEIVFRDSLVKKMRRLLVHDELPVSTKQADFFKRAKRENEIFHMLHYADGCSLWGSAYIHAHNPACRMFQCGCFLRTPFYETPIWDYESCDKHTVLALMTRPEKGVHMLLRAMCDVVKLFPDATLILAGDHFSYRDYHGLKRTIQNLTPDYYWYIQNLIEENHLRGNVRFLHYLNAEKMKKQMLSANVFVCPSSHEHLATAFGEARILGTPSIATAVGALPEMIDHGRDGYLYQFYETHVLAQYICNLFENESLAKQFSVLGREHAGRTYNREENSRKLLDMYDAILADQK